MSQQNSARRCCPPAAQEETVRAFLTYAPADGRAGIPPLECIGDDERAAFAEVEQRLALQRSLPQPEADQTATQRA